MLRPGFLLLDSGVFADRDCVEEQVRDRSEHVSLRVFQLAPVDPLAAMHQLAGARVDADREHEALGGEPTRSRMAHGGVRDDDLDVCRRSADGERSEPELQAAPDAAGEAPAHEPMQVDLPLRRPEPFAHGRAGYERHVAFLAGLAAHRIGPAGPLAIGGQDRNAVCILVLVAGDAEQRTRPVQGRVFRLVIRRLGVLQRAALDLTRLKVEGMIRPAKIHVGDRVAEVARNTLPGDGPLQRVVLCHECRRRMAPHAVALGRHLVRSCLDGRAERGEVSRIGRRSGVLRLRPVGVDRSVTPGAFLR